LPFREDTQIDWVNWMRVSFTRAVVAYVLGVFGGKQSLRTRNARPVCNLVVSFLPRSTPALFPWNCDKWGWVVRRRTPRLSSPCCLISSHPLLSRIIFCCLLFSPNYSLRYLSSHLIFFILLSLLWCSILLFLVFYSPFSPSILLLCLLFSVLFFFSVFLFSFSVFYLSFRLVLVSRSLPSLLPSLTGEAVLSQEKLLQQREVANLLRDLAWRNGWPSPGRGMGVSSEGRGQPKPQDSTHRRVLVRRSTQQQLFETLDRGTRQ